jgi:MtN3 and saliva related transmembrane protein
MDYTIIGLAAALFTSFSGLPQLIKIIKNKHTKDISLDMYILMCLGILLWLIYGLLKNDFALIIANIITIIISGSILTMKIKYK